MKKLIIDNKEAVIGNRYNTPIHGMVLLIGIRQPDMKEPVGLVYTAQEDTTFIWYPSVIDGKFQKV